MEISADTVRQVAKLARLALTEEEVQQLAPQLSDILGYAEQLQEIHMDNIAPTSHSFPLVNVLRKDEVHPGLKRDIALENAPDSDGEQVRVPAVLEG